MKLGKSGISRLLKECASLCGLIYNGTFNDMRYTFAGLLYECNFSGDQIRARLGQSSKQAYENYIRKTQQQVDWKKTQCVLERLSSNKTEVVQPAQGPFTVRPSDFKRIHTSNDAPIPKSMPVLNEEIKCDQYSENTNSSMSSSSTRNTFCRPRILSPNPHRELQLNSNMLYDNTPSTLPSKDVTDEQISEFNDWTNSRRVRPFATDFDDEDQPVYETDTELLFQSYSSNPDDYCKDTASQPFIYNKEFDDPVTQTQIMEDIDLNCAIDDEEKSKAEKPMFPDVPLTQKMPSTDVDDDNDSTKTQFESQWPKIGNPSPTSNYISYGNNTYGPLTQTQFLNDEQ